MFASVQSIMGSDIGPRNLLQVVISTFGVFMGGVINANIFGELTVILAEMTQKEKAFQSKLASINTAMINLNLPQQLQQDTRVYVIANAYSMQS
jgi:hypothetical protein